MYTTQISQARNQHSAIQLEKRRIENKPNFTSSALTQNPINNVSADKFAMALRAVNNIPLASTLSFKGFQEDLNTLRTAVSSCGNQAGEKFNITELLNTAATSDDYMKYLTKGEGVYTSTLIDQKKADDGRVTANYYATAHLEKAGGADMGFLFNVKEGRKKDCADLRGFSDSVVKYQVVQTPNALTKMKTFILLTKGKTLAAVEDTALNAVIMTNAGSIERKKVDDNGETLIVKANDPKNKFTPFAIAPKVIDPINKNKGTGGIGGGLVISMENGRYVAETIKAIEDFQKRVDNGEVDFGPFSAAEGAKDTKVIMLAGGYGSRAEYANAASDRILHSADPEHSDKPQTNKGIISLPTGLNAMETTFKTLHEAGIIDCSKGKFKIGQNVEFYINKAGNNGNGRFTLDIYKKLKGGAKNFIIVPNDAISRMTKATENLLEMARSGKSAMAMIAKMTDIKDAADKLGIMSVDKTLEDPQTGAMPIVGFAEKPPLEKITGDYVVNGDKCLANTFQFAVSAEAFEALDALEPFFPGKDTQGGESRDWSKCYTRIIKALTEISDLKLLNQEVSAAMSQAIVIKPKKPEGGYKSEDEEVAAISVADKEEKGERAEFCNSMHTNKEFNSKLKELKAQLANQRLYAVPTDDSWIDAGNTNDLYHVLMQIASGDFKLSNEERNNLLDCMAIRNKFDVVNGDVPYAAGFIASTPQLKEAVLNKYKVDGEVIAFEKAKDIDADEITKKYSAQTIVNEKSTAG